MPVKAGKHSQFDPTITTTVMILIANAIVELALLSIKTRCFECEAVRADGLTAVRTTL